MKKLMSLCVLFAIAAIGFVGCSKQNSASSGEYTAAADYAAQELPKDARVFTVGFDASFPPYGFTDSLTGKFKGFDLDLAAEVAKRNGWKLVLKAIDWDAKDSELNSGNINCIWNGFTMTEERMGKYTWSAPYVKNEQLILVKADSGIKELADLNGKIVVAQEGSSGAEAVEAFEKEQKAAVPSFAFKDYKKVPDYTGAYTMLDTDAADAIALDSAVAAGFVQKAKGKFVTLQKHLSSENYGIAFKAANVELCEDVQTTLKEMVKDGTVQKILNHWANVEDAKHGGKSIDFIFKAE